MGFCNFAAGKVADVDGSRAKVVCSGRELILNGINSTGFAPGDGITLSIRPENLILAEKNSENALTGTVKSVTYKGTVTRVEIKDIFDETVFFNIHDDESYKAGDAITVAFPSPKLLIYKN
jgi:ABC-type Fe3+/spermidine/putrescine transport system ATPase subunit